MVVAGFGYWNNLPYAARSPDPSFHLIEGCSVRDITINMSLRGSLGECFLFTASLSQGARYHPRIHLLFQ